MDDFPVHVEKEDGVTGERREERVAVERAFLVKDQSRAALFRLRTGFLSRCMAPDEHEGDDQGRELHASMVDAEVTEPHFTARGHAATSRAAVTRSLPRSHGRFRRCGAGH